MTDNPLKNIEPPKTGKWILAGTAVLVVFMATFGAWAGLIPIEAASIAKGSIEVSDKRKSIQHLEGGIVRNIEIAEYDTVSQGDLLFSLDKTRAQAGLNLVTNQLIAAQAQLARLTSEKNNLETITWPEGFDTTKPAIQKIVHEEQIIFSQRRKAFQGKLDLIQNKLEKTLKALEGSKKQLTTLGKQYKLISQQVRNARSLAAKGLQTKQRLNDLEREMLNVEEKVRSLETRIASGEHEINDSKLQLTNQQSLYYNEISELLQKSQLNVSDLTQKLNAAEDVLARTDIRAPINGVVINLTVTTLGGVIGSGETLLEIVPADAKYSVETRIKPQDIDVAEVGSAARVRLTSYKQRITPTLEGILKNISADSLVDENTGEPFYSAVIEIIPDSIGKYPDLKLYPGMPAEVMIVSESRTVVEYLFQPVMESFQHAFREH